ncbi:hypothetical protein AB6A40_010022 [Gnathostoma spinigerum]|uniref:RIIa domain-containing protein n=1 Tax=Gnathostoma spinigerum TaxID=75299 RepID=A0ABD6EU20_9BILA
MADSASEKYKVPPGLRPLLEGLARETLRTQPDDIINFAQLFIDELQVHRKIDPTIDVLKDAAAYERFKNALQLKYHNSLLPSTPSKNSRAQSPMDIAATKIQAAFRGHIVRSNPEKYGLNLTPASDITRRRSNEHIDVVDNRKDLKRHSVGGYALENDNPEDRAATKIQAEIRGFLARKHVEQMRKEDTDAATKIQAHIRGYLTRKHLEEAGIISQASLRSGSNHSPRSNDANQV